MAPTCSGVLELPTTTYMTFLEFSQEFDAIPDDNTSLLLFLLVLILLNHVEI